MTPSTSGGASPEPQSPSPAPGLVVGLGASAGGITALRDFFASAPTDASFAYVVILHLSPEHESKLAEVLQRSTVMPVRQVQDRMALVANQVYVIPPNQTMRVSDGALVLSPVTSLAERTAPVDMFFRTLAEAHAEAAVAIVLSGTGRDGSSGLKSVKTHGGLTIAQNPGEAQFAEMPSNAIATGLVDSVLPIAQIAPRLLQYHDGLRRAVPVTVEPSAAGSEGDALREVLSRLRARTGHDFANYKPPTLKRRIARRMSLHGLVTLADYARLLREQPDEAVALMKDLLISVTHFFRDAEAFAVLEQRVVPRLFEGRTGSDHVRVWSAGCATGEEAYSLAMLLLEHASTLDDRPAIQVFATDLDEQAIAVAREGLYSVADLADVTPERVSRFFRREVAGYRVAREVREVVLFAQHNVLRDPPFSHLDLIACRNLLIYLNRTAQERLMETFHFALRQGGYLFLGTAESPEALTELFVPVERTAHVYERRADVARLPPVTTERPSPTVPVPSAPQSEARVAERISAADLHLRLLEEFAPPSLVVTEEHLVVHVSPHAGRYLRVPGGEPSRDVMRLVHPDLRVDLKTALQLAAQQRTPVEVRSVCRAGSEQSPVKIVVRPVLREGTPARGYFLVLFEEHGVGLAERPAGVEVTSAAATAMPSTEDELARVKAQLRALVEQYETQAEERKAANEELQAMNEELRSSTEELETSKEELQSVNEELTTVNQELKVKVEELRVANNDLQNLINSTQIGAIFLDTEMRIKLSTPRAQDVFNLLPSDRGRRLSDITSELLYPQLQSDVRQVLGDLQPVEREVAARDGRWFLVQIVPYRTADNHIDGVALTLVDITRRHRAEGRVAAGEERLRLLIDSAVDYAIFTMRPDGRIDSWNSGAERLFGYRAEEIIGEHMEVLFTPEDRAAGVPQQELGVAARTGRATDSRWHLRKGGDRFYASGVTMRLGATQGVGFAKIARDLTAQRTAEIALEQARAELEARVSERTAALQSEVAQHAAARNEVTRLLRQTVTAQEEERARIARDLHDQLGQQLTALRMALEQHHARGNAGEELDRALALAREIDGQIDFLAWELRPSALDHLGLAAALPQYLQEWSKHYGVTANFQTMGALEGRLSREGETTFYRVAQEALTNVIKHAHATRVDVILDARGDTVVLIVEDDGIGFDPAEQDRGHGALGLAGMRERAALIGADLQIESTPGAGTTLYLRCPRSGAARESGA